MDQFILFGDSITQQAFSQKASSVHGHDDGFLGPALSDAYVRKLDIINRGLSGYNTRQALKVLPQVIPPPEKAKVRLLTIFLGANDARLPDTPPDPQQHVPIDEYNENLRAIVTHPCLRAHDGVRVILITPPPIHEQATYEAVKIKWPNVPPMIRHRAPTTGQYAQKVRELGQELDVPVVDIWSDMLSRCGYSSKSLDQKLLPGSSEAEDNQALREYLHDGLHFSRSAYELLFERLIAVIERTWPDQLPERIPFVLPAWDDVNAWKDVGSTASRM
jgi:isoamyl acetate esterase